jgi:peptidoglycan/xylan/chitin deacetylase (PgdA/CDA1 family)
MQVANVLGAGDKRKATPLSALQVRAIDQSAAPLKPFDEPMISVTFDDGWESIYTQAMPLLQKHGIPTTQYVLSDEENNPLYLTFEQMRSMSQAGHEISCHGGDHTDLTILSQYDLNGQLSRCKSVIEKEVGKPVREFASPYGRANPQTIAAIKEHFRSQRNIYGDITTNTIDDQDINFRHNFNVYNILAVTIRRDTSAAQLQAAIDYTIKTNGWLVLNYHQVGDDGSEYGLTADVLESQLKTISQAQARIVTMGDFLDAHEKAGRQ